jgi:predicted RNA-binding Zn-ribbon protein involved in translation (DUF1610 family)
MCDQSPHPSTVPAALKAQTLDAGTGNFVPSGPVFSSHRVCRVCGKAWTVGRWDTSHVCPRCSETEWGAECESHPRGTPS